MAYSFCANSFIKHKSIHKTNLIFTNIAVGKAVFLSILQYFSTPHKHSTVNHPVSHTITMSARASRYICVVYITWQNYLFS